MSNRQFRFERMVEYDDPHTGEGRRAITGHYRVYDRASDTYLGTVERVDDPEEPTRVWRSILPNPHYDPRQGAGCYGGTYVGRHCNPRVIMRFAPSRDDMAVVLAKHHANHPEHRLAERRVRFEYEHRPRVRVRS